MMEIAMLNSVSQLSFAKLGAPIDDLFRLRQDILKDLSKIMKGGDWQETSLFAPRIVNSERGNNDTETLEDNEGMQLDRDIVARFGKQEFFAVITWFLSTGIKPLRKRRWKSVSCMYLASG